MRLPPMCTTCPESAEPNVAVVTHEAELLLPLLSPLLLFLAPLALLRVLVCTWLYTRDLTSELSSSDLCHVQGDENLCDLWPQQLLHPNAAQPIPNGADQLVSSLQQRQPLKILDDGPQPGVSELGDAAIGVKGVLLLDLHPAHQGGELLSMMSGIANQRLKPA